MSDLISRADAIEAVCGVVIDEFDVSPTWGYEVAEKALSALPSAEAVQGVGRYENAMQKLREMPKYLNGVKAKQIKKIPSEAVQGEWRTGKPKENGEYMVTLDAWGHRYIDVMHYAKPLMPNREVDGTCWYRDDDEWGDVVYDDSDIIAWMPLPKPYREESEVEE